MLLVNQIVYELLQESVLAIKNYGTIKYFV